YEEGGSYALTYKHFVFTEDVPSNNSEFYISGNDFVTGKFDVREGKRLVFVGVNLPDFMVNRLKTGYYVNEVFEDADLVEELTKDSSGEATDSKPRKVAFFSTSVLPIDIVEDDPETDEISVSVSRLVAKVVVAAKDEDNVE